MNYFAQVEESFVPYAKTFGAKYLVAVKQIVRGNSEEWADLVEAAIPHEGLVKVWPGGDSWDNPCMCVAAFSTKAAAEECALTFGKSELMEIA